MPLETCSKCLKVKTEKSGSITQWINACVCNRPSAEQPIDQAVRCQTCGMAVSAPRPGSFTQWIFQADSCKCQRPKLEPSSSVSEFKSSSFRGFEKNEEVELEVEADKFPLERYKPLEIVGRGSGGTVYRGLDRLLNKIVAIKVVSTLEREALISFQNEARTTSKLSHPNIIKILDFGITTGGVPFMVLDYISGSSLDWIIEHRKNLDMEFWISLFITIADAVAYAHSAGVLHRDLKPSNVLVVETEKRLDAFLIDFGVAKLQTYLNTATIYKGTAMVGTPAYMSPDLALGHAFDCRSDIYSFGCMMFEALAGRPVFEAQGPMELVSLHATSQPPSLLSYLPDSRQSRALEQIVQTCLQKDPVRRYQDANELKDVLQAALKSNTELAISSPQQRVVLSDRLDSQPSPRRRVGEKTVKVAVLILVASLAVSVSAIWFAKPNARPARRVNSSITPGVIGDFPDARPTFPARHTDSNSVRDGSTTEARKISSLDKAPRKSVSDKQKVVRHETATLDPHTVELGQKAQNLIAAKKLKQGEVAEAAFIKEVSSTAYTGIESKNIFAHYVAIGDLFLDNNLPKKARASYQRALSLSDKSLPPESLGYVYWKIADSDLQLKEHDAAAEHAKTALSLVTGHQKISVAAILNLLAIHYIHHGQPRKAWSLSQLALEACESAAGQNGLPTISTLIQSSDSAMKAGEVAKSKWCLTEALARLQQNGDSEEKRAYMKSIKLKMRDRGFD